MSMLDEMLSSFASLTGDAVGVGLRRPGDEEARMLWVNDSYVRLFGYTRDEAVGRTVSFTNDPDHRDDFIRQIVPQFEAGNSEIYGETWCRTKSGRKIWTSLMILVRNADEGRLSAAIYRDLTWLKARETRAEEALEERNQALRGLEETHQRLLSAINSVPDPLAIWDKDFRLVVCNDAFAPRLLARPGPVEPGTPVETVLREASRSGQFFDAIGREDEWAEEAARSVRAGPISDITHYTDGSVFKAVSHEAANGDTLILATDITELENERLRRESYAAQLERAHAVAQHQAKHDELTGLANRRRLTEALLEMADLRARDGGIVAALHVDLDRFKQVNDTRGHAVGDSVLISATERLKYLLKSTDLLARIGGDEFVILRHFLGDNIEPMFALAQSIVASMSAPFELDGQEIRIGASVGIASTLHSSEDDLLTDSDIALYKAKSAGRGRVGVFESADFNAMELHKRLCDEILRGFEERRFIPYYQPQVCAQTHALVGLEVLARWCHPERGILTPDLFLPIADDLALVDRLDEMIFDTAFEECVREFQGDDAPTLSFNVSHRRLMSRGILNDAARAQTYSGGVAFELLESILLDERDSASQQQLDALRDSGARLDIDDFGSGHASIIGLGQVSPDRLKIDRRLIAPVIRSERAMRMVRSIVELAGALEIGVTAEGVETDDQAKLLRDIGCDTLQGFAFGRPAPLATITAQMKGPGRKLAARR